MFLLQRCNEQPTKDKRAGNMSQISYFDVEVAIRNLLYEEFARLAETRLAQNTLINSSDV